jgi:hypothetical protein
VKFSKMKYVNWKITWLMNWGRSKSLNTFRAEIHNTLGFFAQSGETGTSSLIP